MEQLIFYITVVNLLFGLVFYKRLRLSTSIYFAPFIPLAIAGVQAISQLSRAKKQKKAAKEALNYRNPALDAATNSARAETISTRHPGQDVEEQNIRQGTADAFSNVSRASRSSGEVLNAASRLQSQQQRGYSQVGAQNQIFRQNAMDKYRQMLLRQAGVRDENRQYSETLKGAAAQNEYNALNSALGGVAATNFGGGGGSGNVSGAGNAVGSMQAYPQSHNIGSNLSGWGYKTGQPYRWNTNAYSGSIR